jgi:segregation and condensation protein B
MHAERQQARLSQAALETLSIIAYRQPVMRAEIEAIRGVACGEVLRHLLERRLIKIAGRAEELGRPMLYGTTHEFLKVFGLASLEDLPAVEGMERK